MTYVLHHRLIGDSIPQLTPYTCCFCNTQTKIGYGMGVTFSMGYNPTIHNHTFCVRHMQTHVMAARETFLLEVNAVIVDSWDLSC